MINETKKEEYKTYIIYRNYYDEYNVCKEINVLLEMVDSKASFPTLREAKKYIDSIPLL